jgi:hypothetical protein
MPAEQGYGGTQECSANGAEPDGLREMSAAGATLAAWHDEGRPSLRPAPGLGAADRAPRPHRLLR